MKILLVITKSEIGGAQNFALYLAQGLKLSGEDVVVAGGPGEYLPAELEKSGIPFRRLKNLERGLNPLKWLRFLAELNSYVAQEKFNVVHLNSTNALLGVWGLSRLQPKPRLVFTVHGLSLLDGGHKAAGVLRAAYRLFFKAAFRKLDDLIFVSRLNQEFAIASGLLKVGAKSHLVYNGRDFAPGYLLDREAARGELAKILGLVPEAAADFQTAFVYGSIGRLAYPKNYEFLINVHKAARAIRPNAKLLLIGEGPERAKYEGLIKSYKLENEVLLGGEIKDASRFLKSFDLFVLPSIFEGLSLSLIEAVRAGIPALASRVGGNEEIIGPEKCFNLNDQAVFLKLLSNLGESEKSGSGTGLAGQDFSTAAMVKEYLRIYRS